MPRIRGEVAVQDELREDGRHEEAAAERLEGALPGGREAPGQKARPASRGVELLLKISI